MFTTLLGLPAILITIGALIGGAVVGFLYIAGIIGKAKSEDIQEAKDASEYVINTLKEKIEILEQKALDAENARDEINKRLDVLQTENKTLREILEGKDSQTLTYQNEARKTFARAEEIFNIVSTTNKNVERLYKAIEKHLSMLEKGQIVTVTTAGVESTLT